MRTVSPGFFATLDVPIIGGCDFNENDGRDDERIIIVSQSVRNGCSRASTPRSTGS